MRGDRFDRRLKSWWRAAEDHPMPQEDEMDDSVDTQPMPVEEGFLDFDAPGYRPVVVMVEKPHPVAVLMELERALREDDLQ